MTRFLLKCLPQATDKLTKCTGYEKNPTNSNSTQVPSAALILLFLLAPTLVFKGICRGQSAFFRPFREDDVLASDFTWTQPPLADPQLVLLTGRPEMQKGPVSFMLLFQAPKSIEDKQAKKYYMQKGERFISVCFFVPLS